MRPLLALLITALWLSLPPLARAQPAPALVIQLRDRTGQGVPDVTILVRDRSGQQALGEARTGPDGRATIASLPVAEARVAVRGAVAGVSLTQLGDDAPGLLVYLDAPTVTVDLRIGAGGVVVPDPAMFAVEPVPASSPLPTVPLTATAALPGSPPSTPGAEPGLGGAAIPPAASADRGWPVGLLLIFGILAAMGLALSSARRAP